MEPFGYPENDSGPQTLLTSLTPEQNMGRLYWLMGRFQGYVGLTGAMGARFTASEPSFAPILRETAKRGLIFVDDGSNPRSVAGRIAGANSLPFAKPTWCSIRCRRRPKSTARWAGWKCWRASMAARSASLRRCRCRSINRQMGESGGKPRHPAGADHRGRPESQAELRRASGEIASSQ